MQDDEKEAGIEALMDAYGHYLTIRSLAKRWYMHPDDVIEKPAETVYYELLCDKDVNEYVDELDRIRDRFNKFKNQTTD